MNVTLHVERLVIQDVPVAPGDRPRLQATIEAELARRLAQGGLSPALLSGGAHHAVPAPPVDLTDARPAALGGQIARAVFGGIGG